MTQVQMYLGKKATTPLKLHLILSILFLTSLQFYEARMMIY